MGRIGAALGCQAAAMVRSCIPACGYFEETGDEDDNEDNEDDEGTEGVEDVDNTNV